MMVFLLEVFAFINNFIKKIIKKKKMKLQKIIIIKKLN